MKFKSLMLVFAFLAAGCGESGKLAEPQREALDKAQAVEQTVADQAAQQREEAERQSE
jgi:hypothetical protein